MSGMRLFGSWLTTRVTYRTNDRTRGPGVMNERASGTFNLPNVEELYASTDNFYRFPGILMLENLDDGRDIRIMTNQEDSEVLYVRNNTVFYRVNDAIYASRIEQDRLDSPELLVRDDDVPEVHWMFWSPPS
jgi:hypothetical protein